MKELAKMGYTSALEEGVGALPALKTSSLFQDYPIAAAKEGWALIEGLLEKLIGSVINKNPTFWLNSVSAKQPAESSMQRS